MKWADSLVVRMIAAIVAAIILTLLTGLLTVRANARSAGLVIDFTNTPTGLTAPGSPWLQDLGVTIIAAASIILVWPRRRHTGPSSYAPALAMGIVLVGLAAWFLATASGADTTASAGATDVESTFYGRAAAEPAALTWLRLGALSPAIHVVLAVCFLSPLLTRRGHRSTSHPSP